MFHKKVAVVDEDYVYIIFSYPPLTHTYTHTLFFSPLGLVFDVAG